jgi:hypothetical protein
VRKSEVLTIILLLTAVYEKVVDICSCTSIIVEIYLTQSNYCVFLNKYKDCKAKYIGSLLKIPITI